MEAQGRCRIDLQDLEIGAVSLRQQLAGRMSPRRSGYGGLDGEQLYTISDFAFNYSGAELRFTAVIPKDEAENTQFNR